MATIIPFTPSAAPAVVPAMSGRALVLRFPAPPAVPSPAPPAPPAPVRRAREDTVTDGVSGGSRLERQGRAESGFAGSAYTRPQTRENDERRAMLAKVHIAKKDLMRLPGFDDGAYRFLLEYNFGVSSAADLSRAQLHDLLIHFASLGWKAKKGRRRREAPSVLTHDPTGMSREARMEKIEAMLAEKGRAEGTDMPWGYAVAILKRQTANDPAGQVKRFEDARPAQLDDVIAALYRDAKRKGRRAR